jgi:hypothetical protein
MTGGGGLYLGVDVGTAATRVSLVHPDGRAPRARGCRDRRDHGPGRPRVGRRRHRRRGRKADPLVPLLEQVVSLVRQYAPKAAIAFNTSGADSVEAAQRWL